MVWVDCYKAKVIKITGDGVVYGGNIQGGMAYPLEQDFAGFDITVDGTPIDKRKAFSLMNEYEIPTVPVLGVAPSLSDSLVHNERQEYE